MALLTAANTHAVRSSVLDHNPVRLHVEEVPQELRYSYAATLVPITMWRLSL